MKKWKLSLASLFTLSLLTVGCSNNEVGESGGDVGSTKNEEIKLSMWVHVSEDTVEGRAYKMRADAFNQQYDGQYEVKVEFIARGGGGTGYDDKLNASLTTNTLPDVFTIDGPNTSAYAKSNVLLKLDDYISEESLNGYVATGLEQGKYNDGIYSLPIQESTCVIYYNKDMFVEAGIINSVDTAEEDLGITVQNPWTFEEFEEISQKLVDTFKKPAIDLHLGSQDEWITYALTPFVWTSGGDIVSEDGLTATGYFNQDGTVKGLSYLQELVQSGISTTTPEENAFEVGTYPMSLSSSWTVPILNVTYKDQVPNWGVLPYPVGDSGDLFAPTGSWAFVGAQTTKNPAAVATLVEWMTNDESTTLVTEATGLLPARTSVLEENTKYAEGPYQVMAEQLLVGGKNRPKSVGYPEVTFSFQQAVDRITNGQDVLETVTQLATQLDVKLERHKR